MSPLFARPDLSPTLMYFDNMGAGSAAGAAQGVIAFGTNSLVIQPIAPYNELFPGDMIVSTAMLNISHAALTATLSSSAFSSSFMIGVYTRVNSTQLSLVNSVNTSITKAAATANTTLFSGGGARWLTIHSSQWSAPPVFSEERYWFAVLAKTSGLYVPASSVGQYMLHSLQRFGTFGSSNVTATSMKHFPFMGVLSASTTAIPATLAESQINAVQASAGWIPHIVFNNRESVL